MGCALPIDGARVRSWIDLYKRVLANPQAMNEIIVKPGGDLEEKKSDEPV